MMGFRSLMSVLVLFGKSLCLFLVNDFPGPEFDQNLPGSSGIFRDLPGNSAKCPEFYISSGQSWRMPRHSY
jgi:hypothetical protein